MNCFEARQEFTPFWRRRLAPERRQALLAHLRDCSGCDRAFRVFALSAPVLQSEPDMTGERQPAAAFMPNAGSHRPVERRSQRTSIGAISAAAAMLVAASLAAYLSAAVPRQTLQDALEPQSQPSASSELIGELAPTSADGSTNPFAG